MNRQKRTLPKPTASRVMKGKTVTEAPTGAPRAQPINQNSKTAVEIQLRARGIGAYPVPEFVFNPTMLIGADVGERTFMLSSGLSSKSRQEIPDDTLALVRDVSSVRGLAEDGRNIDAMELVTPGNLAEIWFPPGGSLNLKTLGLQTRVINSSRLRRQSRNNFFFDLRLGPAPADEVPPTAKVPARTCPEDWADIELLYSRLVEKLYSTGFGSEIMGSRKNQGPAIDGECMSAMSQERIGSLGDYERWEEKEVKNLDKLETPEAVAAAREKVAKIEDCAAKGIFARKTRKKRSSPPKQRTAKAASRAEM